MSRYENGKIQVLVMALECAIQDRNEMCVSLASQVPNFWSLPRAMALAKLSDGDRKYFLECESYVRDFEKMKLTLHG